MKQIGKNTNLRPLGNSNTHYILIDTLQDSYEDGVKACRGSDIRIDLLKKCKSPTVNLILGGSKRTLETLVSCLEDGIPCWMVENTGGVTDFLIPFLHCFVNKRECNVQKCFDLLLEWNCPELVRMVVEHSKQKRSTLQHFLQKSLMANNL